MRESREGDCRNQLTRVNGNRGTPFVAENYFLMYLFSAGLA